MVNFNLHIQEDQPKKIQEVSSEDTSRPLLSHRADLRSKPFDSQEPCCARLQKVSATPPAGCSGRAFNGDALDSIFVLKPFLSFKLLLGVARDKK